MKVVSKKYLAPLAVLLAGSILSLFAFSLVYKWERRSLEYDFVKRAEDRRDMFRHEVAMRIEVLYYLKGLYAANSNVSREQFRRFTEVVLEHHPDMLALSWIPRVAGVQREDFEATARREGYADFRLTELGKDGNPAEVTYRREYFPIFFIEPFEENKVIFGFDVASDPSRKAAMEQAAVTGSAAATAGVKLIGRPEDFGCRLFLPVYFNFSPHNTPEEYINDIRGFVSVLFDVGRITEASLRELAPAGIDVYLFDVTSSGKEAQLLYFHPSRLRKHPAGTAGQELLRSARLPQSSAEFGVAGRKWRLLFRPLPGLFSVDKFRQCWMVLLSGLLLTLVLFLYIFDLSGRSSKIEALVQQRTAALRESEGKLRQFSRIVEQSPSVVMITDTKGNIEYVNPKFTQLTGYAAEEVVGRNARILKSGKFTPEEYKELWSALVMGNEWRGEFHNIRKNGELYWELASLSPIKNAEGLVEHYLKVSEDITARKGIEEQLNRAYEMTWDILAHAPFGIYLVDGAGSVDFVNPAMLAISGATYEQFTALNMLSLPTYRKIGIDEKIRKCLQGEKFSVDGVEYSSYIAHRLSVRNFTGIPLVQAGERKALIIVEDISERKRLEKLKDEFVSNVSHELRTPLSIIKEGISLVLDGVIGSVNPRQEGALATAKDNIDRLSRIIDELLDISRIESGKFQLKCSVIDVVELVKRVSAGFDVKIREKGLELKLNFSLEKIYLYADADKITEVFVNLLGNAVKFTAAGHIDISVEEKQDEVACCVGDTGIGIAEDNLPKLFDKFQQFGRVSGPGEKGTGLGLSIVKGLIKMHGGEIRVESRLGQGTKFIFTLPKTAEVLP